MKRCQHNWLETINEDYHMIDYCAYCGAIRDYGIGQELMPNYPKPRIPLGNDNYKWKSGPFDADIDANERSDYF